ncbi:DUF1569 domain-containing protein [Flavobacterium soyangense]|uniref:DUF1569 domain-containing protein n=1 Tax=Flavobacterium soyangense TaxID=2023265 RepID=A0A930XZC5_9FLAO|nr:DUF1569 domain-containing protein [Flavobacterium soyangense]MBF2708738.1 DUF1569 domain-containing protein [Flavobacterium soyangense]
MKKLHLLLEELETKIKYRDIENLSVSKSNVSWHINHTLKVLILIIETLKNSKPNEYKRSFNFKKQFVFITGVIPRGKAKAPKSVQSFDEITLDDLLLQLKNAKFSVCLLNHLNDNCNFIHSYFGVLNLKETEKFLIIHTKHHIKIINDIVQKKS